MHTWRGEIVRHVAAKIRTAQVNPCWSPFTEELSHGPHPFTSTSVFLSLWYKFLGGHVTAYIGFCIVRDFHTYAWISPKTSGATERS